MHFPYICPVMNCIIILTTATLNHTIIPKSIGFNPALVISLKFELSPIADRAITIKNFPNSFI